MKIDIGDLVEIDECYHLTGREYPRSSPWLAIVKEFGHLGKWAQIWLIDEIDDLEYYRTVPKQFLKKL